MITARAPHFVGAGSIDFTEHEYRDAAEGELRIRIGANAICGTDRGELAKGSAVVPGHEAAGVVESAGPGTSTAVGTRGAIFLMDYCGACRPCLAGATNQCEAKRQDTGFTSDGGFGPYAIVHESQFFPIPDEVSYAEATMLLDVMGTSGHALRRAERMHDDIRSILVAGAGPIGLGLIAMARVRYGDAVPVHVSDVSEWRLGLAASLGAITHDARDEQALHALQADAAFDASGRQAARETALRSLAKRGVLVCVGHGESLALDVSGDLIAPERAVLGSEYFRFDEMADNLAALLAHRELIGRIITHEVPVERLEHAFELFLGGETGKVVVTQELA